MVQLSKDESEELRWKCEYAEWLDADWPVRDHHGGDATTKHCERDKVSK